MTPDLCARHVSETVPFVMRFIRRQIRTDAVPQLRALNFLYRHPLARKAMIHLDLFRSKRQVMTVPFV